MPSFFIITPPGLEEISECELREWLNELHGGNGYEIKRLRGGLEIDLPIETGFALNHVLKTASRILLRASDFGCRDFPKLFRKTRNFPWEEWVFPGFPEPEVNASTHNSRLKMKKRIEETCVDGFRAWRKNANVMLNGGIENKSGGPSLFVRFENDICFFSLDTSGEHLHKRGYRVDVPEAPIRETVGAALVLKLFEGACDREWTLIDPMAGSGTLLLEAAGLGSWLAREYAFQNFASVRDGRILAIKSARTPHGLPKFSNLFGVDRSPETLRAARSNAERAKCAVPPRYFEGDLVETGIAEIPSGEAVICNPPYGERLKVEGRLVDFYSRLADAIELRLKPERSGLLLPAKADPKKMSWPAAWKLVSTTSFSNGGIPVVFYVHERRSAR